MGDVVYEFFDKFFIFVFFKIKDWLGMKWIIGDGVGNVSLGMELEWMVFFFELEFNYDVSWSFVVIVFLECIGLIRDIDVFFSFGVGLLY